MRTNTFYAICMVVVFVLFVLSVSTVNDKPLVESMDSSLSNTDTMLVTLYSNNGMFMEEFICTDIKLESCYTKLVTLDSLEFKIRGGIIIVEDAK